MDVDQIVCEIVASVVHLTDRKQELIESGIVDSFDLMQIIGLIESRLGVHVNGEDIVPENFSSIEAIVAFVGQLRQ